MELFSNLTKDEEKRIVLVHAMRDSKEELKKLYVADAKEVFILGDSGELDDVEYYHDSMNVCLLNTSYAADDLIGVYLGCLRLI